jgi:hypothetical protein
VVSTRDDDHVCIYSYMYIFIYMFSRIMRDTHVVTGMLLEPNGDGVDHGRMVLAGVTDVNQGGFVEHQFQ